MTSDLNVRAKDIGVQQYQNALMTNLCVAYNQPARSTSCMLALTPTLDAALSRCSTVMVNIPVDLQKKYLFELQKYHPQKFMSIVS